jgi:HK97 family phage prohead protease
MKNKTKKNNLEVRQYECQELRAERTNDGVIVRGYAAVFDSLSEDLGGFKETINKRAFDNVMNDDVVALLNHDNNIVFGRTSSGTLKLSVDERGLVSEIRMPNTSIANDTITLMERGDISKMSFGFYVDKDKWQESERGFVREVQEVKRLVDVSLVTRPAYNETTAAVRSLDLFKQSKPASLELRKLKHKLLKFKK